MHKKIVLSIISILFIIFISIILIVTNFIQQLFSLNNLTHKENYSSHNSNSLTITNNSSTSDSNIAQNSELMKQFKKISNLATTYKNSTNTSDSQIELCLQFIRRNTYNDSNWNLSAGSLNINFIDFVKQNDLSLYNYDFNTPFIDTNTSQPIDFIHMCACLNSILYPSVIPSDFSGWAGDLITLMGEIIDYDKNKTDEELLNYAMQQLGNSTNTSTFNKADLIADIDAIMLSKLTKNNFYDLIYYYYYTNNNIISNRKYYFKNYLENNIYNSVQKKLSGILNQTITLQILSDSQIEKYKNNYEKYNNIVAITFNNYFLN